MFALLASALIVATATQQIDTTVTVRPGSRLDLNNFEGSVTVGDLGQERGTGPGRSRRDEGDVDVDVSGSSVSIRSSGRYGPETVDYQLTVPVDIHLAITGQSGDVTIDGTKGEISVETVEGEIRVTGGAGLISLRSVDGSITLSGARGRMELNSVDGEIRLTNVAGEIRAQAVDGEITMDGVDSSVGGGPIGGRRDQLPRSDKGWGALSPGLARRRRHRDDAGDQRKRVGFDLQRQHGIGLPDHAERYHAREAHELHHGDRKRAPRDRVVRWYGEPAKRRHGPIDPGRPGTNEFTTLECIMIRMTVAALMAAGLVPVLHAQEPFKWQGKLAAGKTIEIKNINGDVHATGGSGSDVTVTARKSARKSNPDDVEIRVVEHENGVTICAVYPSRKNSRPTIAHRGLMVTMTAITTMSKWTSMSRCPRACGSWAVRSMVRSLPNRSPRTPRDTR